MILECDNGELAAIVILINRLARLIEHPADADKNETGTPDDGAGQSKPIARGDYHRRNEKETAQDLKYKSKYGSFLRHKVKSSFISGACCRIPSF